MDAESWTHHGVLPLSQMQKVFLKAIDLCQYPEWEVFLPSSKDRGVFASISFSELMNF